MFFRKAQRIKELEDQNAILAARLFDMEHAKVEAEQFERIAAGKLKEWVEKHDALLISFKALKKEHGIE